MVAVESTNTSIEARPAQINHRICRILHSRWLHPTTFLPALRSGRMRRAPQAADCKGGASGGFRAFSTAVRKPYWRYQ